MNDDEIGYLFAVIMSYDNRNMPGDANRHAWHAQAKLGRWTLPVAVAAVNRYFATATQGAWLMPGDINAIIDDVRKKIRAAHTDDVCPPRELADDPRAEIEWRRTWFLAYEQRALEAWARGEALPPVEIEPELSDAKRPLVEAAVRSFAARKALTGPRTRGEGSTGRDDAHRARLDAARRELDNVRPRVERQQS